MRNIYFILFVTLFLSLTVEDAWAQDPQFSQPYAAPMFLNPALCGDTYQNRIALNYRNQWSGIPGSFKAYSASFDHRFKRGNNAIGISAIRDQAGVQGLRYSDVSAYFSHGVRTGTHSGLRFGLRLGYATRDHDKDKLLFWDQVVRGGAAQTIEPFLMDKISYMDAGSGVVYYSKKFWGGFSATHLNRPAYSLMDSGERMPVRYSIHTGFEFKVGKTAEGSEPSTINPVVHYKWEQGWEQLDIGAYWSKNAFMLGMWYRGIPIKTTDDFDYLDHDAIILMAGIEIDDRFRVGYSYDLTVSRLVSRTGGSHEIALVYEWPNEEMKKRQLQKIIPCPKF